RQSGQRHGRGRSDLFRGWRESRPDADEGRRQQVSGTRLPAPRLHQDRTPGAVKALLILLSFVTLWGADASKGKELFRSCSGCHNTESDEKKMGPSLRTLFGKVNLRNGQRVNDDNVRELILEGFNGMPSFR